MAPVASALYLLLTIFLLLLIFRLIMEYVFILARSFRPAGLVAMALELIYSLTDPPLRLLRRFIPPLRIGGVSLDLGFLILILLVQILRNVVAGLPV